jgi:hypothetical protein
MKFYKIILFVYLLYIQIFPITQDNNQLLLLGIILMTSLLKHAHVSKLVGKEFSLNQVGINILTILMINSFIFTAYGFLKNQPGASEYVLLDITLPLIYIIILLADNSKDRLKMINLSFTLSTLVIGIFFALQMLNFGGASDFIIKLSDSEVDQRVAFDQYGTVVGLRFIPLYSLSYLTPISLHSLGESLNKIFTTSSSKNTIKNTWQDYLLLLLNFFSFNASLLCMFVAARQGLIVGFFASLIILLLLSLFYPQVSNTKSIISLASIENLKGMKASMIRLIIMILISGILLLSVNKVANFIKIDFEYLQGFSAKNKEDLERIGQANALVSEWSGSPVIGHGNGSVSTWIRDPDRPWRYELSFLLRLQNTGLIGTTITYSTMIYLCYILFVRFSMTGNKFILYSLAGLISLLIADLTNPYTTRFTVSYYIYYCVWLSMLPDQNLMILDNVKYSRKRCV